MGRTLDFGGRSLVHLDTFDKRRSFPLEIITQTEAKSPWHRCGAKGEKFQRSPLHLKVLAPKGEEQVKDRHALSNMLEPTGLLLP